jgi:predicted ArsR family transcriptional regulator
MVLDPEFKHARALGDATRYRIHRLVVGAERPIAVAELAEAVGLHPNAVRQHLAVLRDAGLIDEHRERRGRGRPRLVYQGPATAEVEPYAELATMLAEVTAGQGTALTVGRRHGASRAAGSARGPEPAAGDPVSRAADAFVAEARRLGFDPMIAEADADAVHVRLRTCPFAAAVAVDPDTVCGLHLGMARGIVERMGGAHVEGLTVGEQACHLVIRSGAPRTSRARGSRRGDR